MRWYSGIMLFLMHAWCDRLDQFWLCSTAVSDTLLDDGLKCLRDTTWICITNASNHYSQTRIFFVVSMPAALVLIHQLVFMPLCIFPQKLNTATSCKISIGYCANGILSMNCPGLHIIFNILYNHACSHSTAQFDPVFIKGPTDKWAETVHTCIGTHNETAWIIIFASSSFNNIYLLEIITLICERVLSNAVLLYFSWSLQEVWTPLRMYHLQSCWVMWMNT